MFFCFLWDNDNEAWDLGALDAGDGSVPNMAERGGVGHLLVGSPGLQRQIRWHREHGSGLRACGGGVWEGGGVEREDY
jgi:hypothetical protein